MMSGRGIAGCTLLLITCLVSGGAAEDSPDPAPTSCQIPIVETRSGPICGRLESGGPPGGARNEVHGYLGLPYAAPPIGNRRWAPPAEPQAWEKIRDATAFGAICPQAIPAGVVVETDEDCLFLNVWAPERDDDRLLPVMVFLHGGTFVAGAGSLPLYRGTNLAAAGPVVVVTLNYRLGALGFLAGADSFEGNYGILDQQQALRWVRDNIAAFGGDPARVTLFGQSAGAMSVGIHLAAASSQALFAAAILESNPWAIAYKTPEQARGYAIALGRALDCAPPRRLEQCLRTRSADEIVAAQGNTPQLELLLLGLRAFVPWGPVVGRAPMDRQPNHQSIDKPAILGTNADEGTLFVAEQAGPGGTIGELRYIAETDAAYGSNGSTVRSFYDQMDQEPPTQSLGRIITDDLFVCATREMLGRASVPVWGYQFTHAPSFPIWPRVPACSPALGRVCHAAELPFVFGNPVSPALGATPASFDAEEERLATSVMRLWTGFATNQRPPGTDPQWVRFSVEAPLRLRIDEPLGARMDLEARCRYWDALGYDRTGPLGALLDGDPGTQVPRKVPPAS